MYKKNEIIFVKDVMLSLDHVAVVNEKTLLKEVLEEMAQKRLGTACIVNKHNKLLGVITDGDLRRKLLKIQKPFSALFADDALDHASLDPISTKPTDTLLQAVEQMGEEQIWDLPVLNPSDELVGLLHLHPAVKALLNV